MDGNTPHAEEMIVHVPLPATLATRFSRSPRRILPFSSIDTVQLLESQALVRRIIAHSRFSVPPARILRALEGGRVLRVCAGDTGGVTTQGGHGEDEKEGEPGDPPRPASARDEKCTERS